LIGSKRKFQTIGKNYNVSALFFSKTGTNSYNPILKCLLMTVKAIFMPEKTKIGSVCTNRQYIINLDFMVSIPLLRAAGVCLFPVLNTPLNPLSEGEYIKFNLVM